MLNSTASDVRLIAAPHIDLRRREVSTVPAGTTIAAMVNMVLPGLAKLDQKSIRVTIGDGELLPDVWGRVRPKPGTTVVIRIIPTGGTARTVLALAVTVAAIAVSGPIAGALGFAAGSVGAAAVTVATTTASALLFNALVPIRTPGRRGADGSDQDQSFSVSGFQNALSPGGAVPNILGAHRFAPPYAALPYTEIAGDDQYIVALFNFGYGPLAISNIRLGDNKIENFDGVTMEIRQGFPSEPPVTIYAQQVIEDSPEATAQVPDVAGGSGENAEVVRTTARDVTEASVDFTFPQGLVQFNSSGDATNLSVQIRIRQRAVGSLVWADVTTLTVTRATRQVVRATHRWTLPARGQYEIGVTRLTANFNRVDQSGVMVWSALRGFRPEYPIDFDRPLGLMALRVKATAQLNGIINNLNADVERICPDWDSASDTWKLRATRNPASLYRYVLQGNANAYPRTDTQVAVDDLSDWHDYCVDQGLEYNRAHDYAASLWEVLADVARAGRATPRDNGTAWTVSVDRPKTLVVGHISPRNSSGFSGERAYLRAPDGFRVSFPDETFGYHLVERVIPWPGFVGEPEVAPELQLPGLTNPVQVFREVRRRQYELIHRLDRYTVNQDIEALVLVRGDLAVLSHDVLDRTQVAARVKAISGEFVTLDVRIRISALSSYQCRFRLADGTSLLKQVLSRPVDETDIFRVDTAGGMPAVGDLAFFGLANRVSREVIVRNIEIVDDLAVRLALVDHAPEIEALVNADALPDWAT